ncbi:U3 snoRNP protein [Puccinia graminis f. sp. tritici]|uniref:U3 snoRNP protein n=1 Tax=Puccinia graminis f. sp. tritici TaxID=56615 RepID=A0A5B0QPP2_PUCGR|nr:U3 snoRNP protein [Puccinia graminis f. sp. tritici]KAA1127455.1 U3 snoRNP protein [Puccinia graminis f. sp. tritici]
MESAQIRMERMLPELRDLEQKKTFTKTEISAIVTQRNYYEALIARPKQPECYLKYIEYEKRLEKLRRLRVGKYGHAKGRTTLSDYSIPLHILSLYSAAAKRFPESLELWTSYIAYSLTQASNKLVSRVLSAAIAAHPSHSDFWVMAAQFEADGDETGKGGGNVDGARKLLMRGLRFFKDASSLPLWIEWIRIELNFIQTMEKRREAFGLLDSQSKSNDPSHSTPPEESEHADQALQTTADLQQLPDDPDTSMTPINHNVDCTGLKGQEALLSGALVKVVLQNAFEAIPGLDIFHTVLPTLHAFKSPLRPALLHFLYGKISEMYPDSAKALVMLTTRPLYRYSTGGKLLAVSGEELVDLLSSTIVQLQQLCKEKSHLASMSEEFLAFLIEMHSILNEMEVREYVAAVIRKTVSSAIKRKSDTVNLHQLVISHYENTDAITDGLQLAKTGTQRFPDCLDLWESRLTLLLKTQEQKPASPTTLEVFHEAIQRFPGSIRLAELYSQFLKQQHANKSISDEELWTSLEQQLDTTLKTCPIKLDESRQSARYPPSNVAEVYQRTLAECPGRMALKEFAKYLSNKSVVSLSFLSWLVEFKSAQEDLKALEDLHDLVTSHPHAQLDHWADHLSFLLTRKKDCHGASRLLAKARNSLGRKASEQLEQKWMQINSSFSGSDPPNVEKQ